MATADRRTESLAESLIAFHDESYGWALSCCRWNEPMAEDIVQTAYVRVIAGQAKFEGRSALKTWFFGVIRRIAQEHGRRARSHDEKALALKAEVGPGADPGLEPIRSLERAETTRQLINAMSELAERQREVLHLVFYEGLTIAEAAGVMGVGLGSARTHYDRGKKKLKSILGEEMTGV